MAKPEHNNKKGGFVKREPKEFEEFKQIGKNIGFKVIQSGPLVRSSYNAHEIVV